MGFNPVSQKPRAIRWSGVFTGAERMVGRLIASHSASASAVNRARFAGAQGSESHHFGTAPRSALVDHLGPEQAVDRFGERVAVAVADAADPRLDAGFEQGLGEADRDLRTTTAMVHQAGLLHGTAITQRLLGACRVRGPPARSARRRCAGQRCR
jgi:hypothetical protein